MNIGEFSYVFYFSFLFGCILFSWLFNGLILKFSKTLGTRNNPEEMIRWGSQAKPSLGGISFYVLFLSSFIIYSIFFNENIWANKPILGIFLSGSMGFLIGLADDAYNTRPLLKFLGQLACGVTLIYCGIYIHVFDILILDYFITILWIVGIMNSINMLDNMDAITSVVSLSIILGTLFLLSLFDQFKGVEVLILTGTFAALIGFLFYNWHPAKMYMGDTGSQFIGAFLGGIGIKYFWNFPFGEYGNHFIVERFLIISLVFIIPLIDTTTVVINRIRKKQSPFVGGKDHTTHHLFYHGITERRIAVLFIFLSLCSFVGLGITYHYNLINFKLFFTLGIVYLVGVFALLYLPTRISKR